MSTSSEECSSAGGSSAGPTNRPLTPALQRRLQRRQQKGGCTTPRTMEQTGGDEILLSPKQSAMPTPKRQAAIPLLKSPVSVKDRMRLFTSPAATSHSDPVAATPKTSHQTVCTGSTSSSTANTKAAATSTAATHNPLPCSPRPVVPAAAPKPATKHAGVATAFLQAIQNQKATLTASTAAIPEVTIPTADDNDNNDDEDATSVSMVSSPSFHNHQKYKAAAAASSHNNDWDKLVDDRVRVQLYELERRMEQRLQLAVEHVELQWQAKLQDVERRLLCQRQRVLGGASSNSSNPK